METTQILRLLIEREFPLEGRILDALASCLYLAGIKTKERRYQAEIAKIVNIDPDTLRVVFKEIVKTLEGELRE